MNTNSPDKKVKLSIRVLHVAFFFGQVVSKVYTFKLNLYLNKIFDNFYSGWLIKSFKSCGNNLQMSIPVYATGLKYISVGENFVAGPRLRIDAHDKSLNQLFTPKIVIGNNVNINFDCHIGCIDEIQIGDNVLIASKVIIIDHFHGKTSLSELTLPPMERPLISKGKISIGNNVWIGEGCIIMPGVQVGENCVIGANSVVTKSFEANTIIGGVPAKIIR